MKCTLCVNLINSHNSDRNNLTVFHKNPDCSVNSTLEPMCDPPPTSIAIGISVMISYVG